MRSNDYGRRVTVWHHSGRHWDPSTMAITGRLVGRCENGITVEGPSGNVLVPFKPVRDVPVTTGVNQECICGVWVRYLD